VYNDSLRNGSTSTPSSRLLGAAASTKNEPSEAGRLFRRTSTVRGPSLDSPVASRERGPAHPTNTKANSQQNEATPADNAPCCSAADYSNGWCFFFRPFLRLAATAEEPELSTLVSQLKVKLRQVLRRFQQLTWRRCGCTSCSSRRTMSERLAFAPPRPG
jgi:hypothetical protein